MRSELSPRIAVSPASALTDRNRLLTALEAAFSVRFCAAAAGMRADAMLLLTDGVPLPDDLPAGTGPVFAVPAAPSPRGGDAEEVQLLACDEVDRRMRGIVLAGHVATAPLAEVAAGETVLASAPSGIAWVAAGNTHRVSTALPELEEHEVLRDLLISPHVLSLVALVHFLRRLEPNRAWTAPAVKATMLFDDPNLRRPQYGFIDYEALVAHADAHEYHAAMAMIPLDVAGPHRATVDLFRRRRDRLSLVVHGNNHVKHELSTPVPKGDELALAAQAMRRVAGFEERHGLRVDRVMTPPHGMCSPEMARALGIVGFDALCSLHPLPWREGSPADRLLAGWEAAEFAGPCAVIPRMPLFASAADIALHAFLDHPVVLYGHHEDVADGLEPLAVAAERVNALGCVEWTPMEDIVLGNRAVRVHGDAVLVRPFSGRMRVEMPEQARTLAVLAPRDACEYFDGWSIGDGPLRPFGGPVHSGSGRTLELRLHPVGKTDPAAVAPPPWSPWPIVRRAATELRDRTLPLRPTRLL
jgi:hypothetical protein